MKKCKINATRWILSEIGIDEYLTGEIVELVIDKQYYVIFLSPKGNEYSIPIDYVTIL